MGDNSSPKGLGPSGFDPSRLFFSLKALAAAATPRPWAASKGSPFFDLGAEQTARGESIEGPLVTFHQHGGSAAAFNEQRANRALVAELVNNLPVILDALSDSDGSQEGRDASRLDGEAATARADRHRHTSGGPQDAG